MRILYSAGNRSGSFLQLKRFLKSIKHKNYDIKIAAFQKSSGDLNIDYTLNSLLNFSKPNENISFNGNYSYFFNEIKRFNPDLVISDMEIYSSLVALDLNKRLWQFSPMVLYYAMSKELKYKIGLNKFYAHSFLSNYRKKDYTRSILNNSEKKLVVSYLGDTTNKDILPEGFEWTRPNFILGSGRAKVDILNTIVNKDNFVCPDTKKYVDTIEGCSHFICDGTAALLADAFYNRKYSTIITKYKETENILSSYVAKYFGTGGPPDKEKAIKIIINDDVRFISEHLERF